MTRARPLVALAGVLVVFAAVAIGVLGFVLPSGKPPDVTARTPKTSRLAEHLALVVVDGLRWDVATDPERMPHFSRAMREHPSGELWAGRVSMTTSAVLTMVTGERGGFEQVVFNADPSPPPFDSWLASAKTRGLSVMLVGDPAWQRMYGASIDEAKLDPEGVSIDVDFNPQTFRDARELRAKAPDVLIVHFVTPDHQAHAHTVPSRKYAEHIRGFDADLHAFLDELGARWTIVVAGDHGAADSGTHGADVPIQRKTAIYARGPGIRPAPRPAARLDQADLAGTFAALLGLPLPAHSRGHLFADWLELSPEQARAVECDNAERARALADARGLSEAAVAAAARARNCETLPPEAASRSAREAVSIVDRAIDATTGLASPIVPPLIAVVTVLALALALALFGVRALPAALVALGMGALGVLFTWGVERLPGTQPHAARVVLFSLGNLVPLALLVVPGRVGSAVERFPNVAPALVPGALVATYTTNAQPEAFVAVVVAGLLFVLVGGLSGARTLLGARRVLAPLHLALVVLAAVALFFPGTRTSDVVPSWMRRDGMPSLAAASALIAATGALLWARSTHPRKTAIAILGIAGVVAALALRHVIPAWPGRIAILLSLALAVALALRGNKLGALLSALGCYALVSRDFEWVALSTCIVVADGAGAALARHRALNGTSGAKLALGDVLLATAFLFGIAFVGRIGVQGAIDFGSMDWGAAGFGDPHVPAWVVGGALGLKYVLAVALPVGAFVSELPRPAAIQVLAACFAAFLARGVVVTAMFLIAGGSFWTGLRALGDLPFGFLWASATALLWLGAARPLSASR